MLEMLILTSVELFRQYSRSFIHAVWISYCQHSYKKCIVFILIYQERGKPKMFVKTGNTRLTNSSCNIHTLLMWPWTSDSLGLRV